MATEFAQRHAPGAGSQRQFGGLHGRGSARVFSALAIRADLDAFFAGCGEGLDYAGHVHDKRWRINFDAFR